MNQNRRLLFCVGSLLLLGGAAGCKKGETVQFREHTAEETTLAIEDAFASRDDGEREAIPESINLFFESLGLATRGDGEIVVDDFFSVDAMLDSLKSAGMLDSLDSRSVKGFEKGFKSAKGSFAIALRQMAYDESRVLRLEKINAKESIAYVRHYDNNLNVTTQLRWWLLHTDRGWRIYDFEELSIGLRTVSLMGTMMTSGLATKPEPWIADFVPLMKRIQTIDLTDPENLLIIDKPLRKLRGNKLPDDIKRFASAMTVSVMQVRGDPEGSIAEMEAALDGGYESPLYHYQMGHALTQLDRYEDALESFAKFAKVFGWDSDVLESVSDCHYQLGNIPEARKAALEGLADNPSSINCLCCLAISSSPEEIASEGFRKFIDGCGDAAAGFELAFDYVLDPGLLPQAEAMFGIMDQYLEDDVITEYYEEAIEELRNSIKE